MKKNLLFLIIILLQAVQLKAQCIGAIPSNAVVVNATTTINGGFDPIWVCTPDTLISDGGFHNIFLEHGAVMTTGGGIDTIYVKAGAKFFMNGGIHVIFYLNNSDIFLGGGIPTKIYCDSLKFDYKNAPVNGCVVTGLENIVEISSLPYANFDQSSKVLNIYFKNSNSASAIVRIFSAVGGLLKTENISTSNNSINLAGTLPGIYFYELVDNNLLKTVGKFIIE
ncbi:MAG: T9SS type A sorting domain-containing protein [Chitinophagales bacterium]|nr:T9SS type A sorting domain-containing protein [Chitinophagales bacterium]